MTNIVQHSIILNSRNQLRNADSLAREWAVAHAGAYQGQARRVLGGSDPIRAWQRDDLTIRIAKLNTEAFKQLQLVSVHYEPEAANERYVGYIMTYAAADAEQSGGHFFSVTMGPEIGDSEQLPWDDKAGPVGLDNAVDSIAGERVRSRGVIPEAREIAAIDDLFAIHDAAVVITADGQSKAELPELAHSHDDWAAVVSINPAEQLVISRELPDQQLPAWVRAGIALFLRHGDEDGNRLRLAETDAGRARPLLDKERERYVNGTAGRNALALLSALESVAIMRAAPELKEAAEMAQPPSVTEDPLEATPETVDAAGDAAGRVQAQQRINLLEDQLDEARSTIAELRERLEQYESYDSGVQSEENEAPPPESVVDGNREITVLGAITDPERFPRLRFLTNCEKHLAGYGKPRPNGVEIVAALDAINRLAQAWYNTPDRNIGSWDNYFISLPGWKHAPGESESTMSRYGEKRSFSDQEHSRHVPIARHLTYQGSSGGLQIYFDKDDVTDTFIVGYIGEHLPYATNRS